MKVEENLTLIWSELESQARQLAKLRERVTSLEQTTLKKAQK